MEQMYICLAIFAIMVILFLSRKIPMAFSALIAMVLLIITGCIDANSALATFGEHHRYHDGIYVYCSSRLSQDADD